MSNNYGGTWLDLQHTLSNNQNKSYKHIILYTNFTGKYLYIYDPYEKLFWVNNNYGTQTAWNSYNVDENLPEKAKFGNIVSTDNGSTVYLCFDNYALYKSTTSGTLWKKIVIDCASMKQISISSNGKYCYFICDYDNNKPTFYSSSNYGNDWIPCKNLIYNGYYVSSTCSSDGKTVYICENDSPGSVFVSTNYGQDWKLYKDVDQAWTDITTTSDGKIVYSSFRSTVAPSLENAISIADNIYIYKFISPPCFTPLKI